MRKDVILGMTIGGVMLALIVTYLTVSTGGKPNKHVVELAGGGTADVGTTDISPSNGAADDSGGRTPLDVRSPQQRIDPAKDRGNYKPTVLLAGEQERRDEKWGEKLFGKASAVNITSTPDPNARQQIASGGGIPQLQGGGDEQQPPTAADGVKSSHGGAKSTTPTTSAAKPKVALAGNDKPTGTPPANGATQQLVDLGSEKKTHTHKVQKGETYSTIAAAAYGSPNYYPHLIRANPNIDPTKLKPGMEINIPDISDVKPSTARADAGEKVSDKAPDASPAAHRTEPAIDSRTEYRVQSGDSLHKIAIKLYGKVEMVDRIYELNQAAIGPDKAKLKLGMVLKLPEAPTANR